LSGTPEIRRYADRISSTLNAGPKPSGSTEVLPTTAKGAKDACRGLEEGSEVVVR
jgi:hypothetical protein